MSISFLKGFKPLTVFYATGLLFVAVCLLALTHRWSEGYGMSNEEQYSCNTAGDEISDRYALDRKQRGMHFFSSWTLENNHYEELAKTNIEWLVHVPFGWQDGVESTKVRWSFRNGGAWRKEGSIRTISRESKKRGFRSMMKPHLWLSHTSDDRWRGSMYFDDPTDWKAWSESYRQFVLHYARLSAELGTEVFCIGTELHRIAVRQPDYWISLIREVRSFYDGKITYAANWNTEYEEIPFWNELDFIGIQAYFPLTDQRTPPVRELVAGWQPYARKMERLSRQYGKPILFTEIGYKSTDDAAIDPWKWVGATSSLFTRPSYETQANCYEAFFRVFWEKEWFAGAHFWEWQAGINTNPGKENISFSPQKKPAESTLAKWFGTVVRKK